MLKTEPEVKELLSTNKKPTEWETTESQKHDITAKNQSTD